MSSDCEKLIYLLTLLAFVIVGPLVLLVVAWFSYKEMGYPALMGLGIVLLMLPFQGKENWFETDNCTLIIVTFILAVLSIYLFSKFRLETARKQDKRIGLMNEIISSIKLIKMYCWESQLAKRISKAREEEIGVIRSANLYMQNYYSSNFSIIHKFFRKVALFRAFMLTIEWSGITIGIFSMMESKWKLLKTMLKMLTSCLLKSWYALR